MSISFCDFLRKTVNSSCCIYLYMITTDEIVKDAQKQTAKQDGCHGVAVFCITVRTFELFTLLSFRGMTYHQTYAGDNYSTSLAPVRLVPALRL